MFLIARDQVVRAGRSGTFQEGIAVGVACDRNPLGRKHRMVVVFR
jgi:hypothetical protein